MALITSSTTTAKADALIDPRHPFARHLRHVAEVDRKKPHAAWTPEFDAWVADALSRGDIEELSAFRTRAPGVRYAHPTVEHFTPLFVTLGSATDPTARVATAIGGYAMGLSKRSIQAA